MRELRIDVSVSGRPLVDGTGGPVWPGRGREERASLFAAASLLGVAVREVSALEVDVPTGDAPVTGCVVGIGAACRVAASVYAHLTGRPVFLTDGWGEELQRLDGAPAVIITTPSCFTFSLLEAVFEWSLRATTPGIICGDPDTTLWPRVLVRALYASADPRVAPRRVDVVPGMNIGVFSQGEVSALGGRATPDDVTEAMSSGAGVLSILTHSDAFDASLQGGTILCSLADGGPRPMGAVRAPRCAVTGVCHRLGIGVEEAVASANVVSPRRIAASVLVFASCSVLCHADDETVDPEWSLGLRLAQNPRIGAVLLPTDTIMASMGVIAPLVDAIANGEAVGDALAAFHRSPEARRFGIRFVLLGDPRVRLAKTDSARVSVSYGREGAAKRALTAADVMHARMLRHGISASRPTWKRSEQDAAENALALLDAYEDSGWGAADEGVQLRLEAKMQQAVLDYVVVRGWSKILAEWMTTMPPAGTIGDSERCGLCDGRLTVFTCAAAFEDAGRRRFAECSKCGALESVPEDDRITMLRAAGRVRLGGSLPRERWKGRFVVWSQWRRESEAFPWHEEPERGAPARTFPGLPSGPIGPLRVGAIFMVRSVPSLVVYGARGVATAIARAGRGQVGV